MDSDPDLRFPQLEKLSKFSLLDFTKVNFVKVKQVFLKTFFSLLWSRGLNFFSQVTSEEYLLQAVFSAANYKYFLVLFIGAC